MNEAGLQMLHDMYLDTGNTTGFWEALQAYQGSSSYRLVGELLRKIQTFADTSVLVEMLVLVLRVVLCVCTDAMQQAHCSNQQLLQQHNTHSYAGQSAHSGTQSFTVVSDVLLPDCFASKACRRAQQTCQVCMAITAQLLSCIMHL